MGESIRAVAGSPVDGAPVTLDGSGLGIFVFPLGTKKLTVQSRAQTRFKVAWDSASIAASKFITLFEGQAYVEQLVNLNENKTLYFSGTVSDVLEIQYWL